MTQTMTAKFIEELTFNQIKNLTSSSFDSIIGTQPNSGGQSARSNQHLKQSPSVPCNIIEIEDLLKKLGDVK